MPSVCTGKWFIDGVDIYETFSVILEEGSAEFLRWPPKKPSIEHDWKDSNGRDVDLTQIFFDQREGTLNMAFICNSRDEFFQKQEAFISHMTQPGLRRLSFASHGERSYYVYYQECNNFKAERALKDPDAGKIAYRFSMVIVEPEPVIDASHTFLIDHDGHFLIT